jgi:membrane protease YdiL (CAAX protease family)
MAEKKQRTMKTLLNILDLRTSIGTGELKPTVILMMSALMLTIHRYFGSMEFAISTAQTVTESQAAFFMFLSAFLLFGIVPLALVILVFRESPMMYGLRLGRWKEGLTLNAILFPIIALALLYPASQTEEMRAFYPFDKSASSSVASFIQFEFVRGVFFYTAWEFFFRGFMLFGLRRRVGDWLAICIQTIPSCLWHVGMPTGEIFSSIAGGILFGIMALRTQSILWPLLLHYLIGVGLDFFIVITS